MNADEIEKLLRRAKSVAIKWGYPQHADDFAQEAFIAIANGAYPKLEWIFITFLRREYGSSRTISGRIRQLAEKYAVRLDAPISEDDGSSLNHDTIGCSESNPESVLEDREPTINYGFLSGREKDIAVMHFEDELSNIEIADRTGLSASQVSQIISKIVPVVKTFTEYKTLLEKTRFDSNFMKIKLR